MENIMFIYDSKESRFSNLECYYIYDTKTNEIVQDIKLNKTVVGIDRKNKLIYFMGMETEEHYILAKQYYYKLIQQFLNDAKNYSCEGYDIFYGTTGGMLYYKYNKEV